MDSSSKAPRAVLVELQTQFAADNVGTGIPFPLSTEVRSSYGKHGAWWLNLYHN